MSAKIFKLKRRREKNCVKALNKKKMILIKALCVIVLIVINNSNATNSDQNRPVVYEKCKGPSE